MKKVAFAVPIALCGATAAQAEPFSGIYAGVEAGMDNYELSADLDGGAFDPTLDGANIALDGLSGDGIVGGAFLGYQASFDGGLFVAAEGFGSFSDADMSLSVSDGVDTIGITAKAKETYGVAGKLGFRVNTSTGVYARLGWINTKFETTLDDGIDTITVGETEDGIQYGAGLETMIGPRTSLRFEYVRSDYGSADLGNGVSLQNDAFRSGLAFRF